MTISSILIATAMLGALSPAGIEPDAVFLHGKIWTVDRQNPKAEAIAIWHGRVAAIGTDAEIERLAGQRTQRFDLGGRRVVPGFFDSHVHWMSGGMRREQVDLRDAKDEAEFGRRLAEFHKKLPPGRWMLGGDWDHDRTFAGNLPTAELLDRYCPGRPVFLRRYDGHMGVVNSHTLGMARITASKKSPSGGEIFRNPDGKEPSGVLRDTAMDLVEKLIPPPADDEIVRAVFASLDHARQLGVTSVEDMAGEDAGTHRRLFRLYQRLASEGKLTTRIHMRWPIERYRELADFGLQPPFGNDFVQVTGLKGFIDGSLGSSTAKMFEPFVNETSSTGLYVTAPNRMRELVQGADAAGLSVAIHAIGDQGNAVMLDIFRDVATKNGPRDRRFRIEHAQHIAPADIQRFADFKVIASMQPYHVIDDGRWAEGRIGAKRCATSYAYRALLDAGAKLAFGSDWQVAPLDVLAGIDAAVNRRTLDGKNPNGWFPQQRITVEQAVDAYTLGSAFASFREKEIGTISPGKLADFVVLSRDILDPAERDHIAETRVQTTVVGGKIVFER